MTETEKLFVNIKAQRESFKNKAIICRRKSEILLAEADIYQEAFHCIDKAIEDDIKNKERK